MHTKRRQHVVARGNISPEYKWSDTINELTSEACKVDDADEVSAVVDMGSAVQYYQMPEEQMLDLLCGIT
jgi:hypothetical protein